MEWYESWKPYAVLSLICPALALVYILLNNEPVLGWVFPAVMLYICFPSIMAGTYMWFTGRGHRFINGPDWSKMKPDEIERTASYVGLWMMIGMIVLLYGLSVILSHIWIGLTITIASAVLLVVMLIRPVFTKITRPKIAMNSNKALWIVAIIAMVSLVPTAYLFTDQTSSGSVDVTLNDSSFTVKAPLFDHTISYADIDNIEIVDNFDVGKRKWGYNDGTIYSGRFHSDTYGDYEAAMYKKITTCITVYVGGDMYAINQDTYDATAKLFDDIKSRMP